MTDPTTANGHWWERDGRAAGASALVADDDAAMRALIVDVLRLDGFCVSEARDGLELLEIVRATAAEDGAPPDVIVSDVRMPGATGIEVLAALRAQLRDTAIILITAFGDAATHAEAARLGAVGVLNKPFDLDDLRTAAMTMARRREAAR